MIVKAGIGLFVLLVVLCVPLVSMAQTSGSAAKSIESLNLQDIADDSIVVLSKDESGLSGYIHASYAYIHSDCPGRVQLVDYYGPAFDVNDQAMRWNERRQCSRLAYDQGDDD